MAIRTRGVSSAGSNEIGHRLVSGPVPVESLPRRRFWRRMLDVIVAGGALVVTLPILVIAAVAIKLDSRGPLLDRQVRIGRDGVEFESLTFRSSSVGGDSQVTWVGRFLRWSSIDQLPLLWNVVRGDMGLVGPPPGCPADAGKESPDDTAQPELLPGITGLWERSDRSRAS